ncbi:MAG: sodium:proton antiporter, partial [Lachnospiraceae bacterium]|nr:sodium:proton antiporter [Lachnospiraceae bacterium]
MLSGKAAKRYTIIYELTLVVMCAAILGYVVETGQPFTYVMGEFPAPWGNEIRAGVLEALFALAFMIIMLASVIGGFQFVKQDIDESKINLYYALINLMTAAIMALLWTND